MFLKVSGKALKEILPECIFKHREVMEKSQHGFIKSKFHVCLRRVFYVELTDVLHVCHIHDYVIVFVVKV